jgi:hypothetical protein
MHARLPPQQKKKQKEESTLWRDASAAPARETKT